MFILWPLCTELSSVCFMQLIKTNSTYLALNKKIYKPKINTDGISYELTVTTDNNGEDPLGNP